MAKNARRPAGRSLACTPRIAAHIPSVTRILISLLVLFALLATACSTGGIEPRTGGSPSEDAQPGAGDSTTTLAATAEAAIQAAERSISFDPNAPLLDVEIATASTVPTGTELDEYLGETWEIEPVGATSAESGRFFIPTSELDGDDPDNVLIVLWNDLAEAWVLLPTDSVDGGVVVWTPHFSIFSKIKDGGGWVKDKVKSGTAWIVDETVDGVRTVVNAVWSVGQSVTNKIVEGLAALDTTFGGTADGPPSCPASGSRPGLFELTSQSGNDDDKILHCNWTGVNGALTLRVTNNRPYGFVGVFDATTTGAEIVDWPDLEIVSAGRILNRIFSGLADRLGQVYIPSGATYEFRWSGPDTTQASVRFESTLAYAAIDPALSIFVSVLVGPAVSGSAADRLLDGPEWFDCVTGFISAVMDAGRVEGVMETVGDAFTAFKAGTACVGKILDAIPILDVGLELLVLVRNVLASLADTVVEGNIKVEIPLTFTRSATSLAVSDGGVGELAFGTDFEAAIEHIGEFLGPPTQIAESAFDGLTYADWPKGFSLLSVDGTSFDGWKMFGGFHPNVVVDGLAGPISGLDFGREPPGGRAFWPGAPATELLATMYWLGSGLEVEWKPSAGLFLLESPRSISDLPELDLFSIASGTGTGIESRGLAQVNADGVNVRLSPSTESSVIGVASSGDEYDISTTTFRDGRQWAGVVPKDQTRFTGWIAAEFLELVDPEAAIDDASWQRIASAEIPSICGHPPTRLVAGEHTGIGSGQGFLNLQRVLFDGLTAGVQRFGRTNNFTAVVALCSAGGVGFPHEVLIFDDQERYFGLVDFHEFDWASAGFSRVSGVRYMRESNSGFELSVSTLAPGDPSCCPSGVFGLRVDVQADSVVLAKRP